MFVNTEMVDEKDNFVGVCGVGVRMKDLEHILDEYEKTYKIKIYLIDEQGLIQVASDEKAIERDRINISYLSKVSGENFYQAKEKGYWRTVKYMEVLDWYLVVDQS